MPGAIAIVLVLVLFPVLVCMGSAVIAAALGVAPEPRRRGPQRGQRAARSQRLSHASVHDSAATEVLDAGDRAVRRRADARWIRRRSTGRGRRPSCGRWPGKTITAQGHRRPRGAAHLRRRARPGVHLRRPSAVLVVRAGRAHRGVDPVRPRRRGVEHLRRIVAGGRRRGVRRERGAALDRRSRRPARRGGRRVRQRRHGRQPQRADRCPLPLAHRADGAHDRTPRAAADRQAARTPVGRLGGPGDGRRRASLVPADERAGCRATALRETIDRAGAERPRAGVRHRRHRRHDQRRRGRRPRRRRRGVRRDWTRGCTSTGPTAAPALAAPSVRDRFAGIEHADSFIVDPHKWLFAPFDCCALLYRDPTSPAPRTPSTPSTSTCCTAATTSTATSGTPATTPTTCPAGPAACRSGSAWRRTAPTPTATRSRQTLDVTRQGAAADRRRRAPRADDGARAERAAVPPHRLDAARLPVVERPAARRGHGVRRARRRGTARCVLRLCIVNPLTSIDDISASSSTRWPEPEPVPWLIC